MKDLLLLEKLQRQTYQSKLKLTIYLQLKIVMVINCFGSVIEFFFLLYNFNTFFSSDIFFSSNNATSTKDLESILLTFFFFGLAFLCLTWEKKEKLQIVKLTYQQNKQVENNIRITLIMNNLTPKMVFYICAVLCPN